MLCLCIILVLGGVLLFPSPTVAQTVMTPHHQRALDDYSLLALDVVGSVRHLQTNDPTQICASYNNATAGIFSCECHRFDVADTRVFCTYVEPQCFGSESVERCYEGTVETILDSTNDSKGVESCITFADQAPAVTCIKVLPQTPGQYDVVSTCGVEYSPTGVDLQDCSCNVCGMNPETGATELSFNCCELQEDLKQSCYPIATLGAAVPNFDPVPLSEQGQCVYEVVKYGNDSGAGTGRNLSIIVFSAIVAWTLLG